MNYQFKVIEFSENKLKKTYEFADHERLTDFLNKTINENHFGVWIKSKRSNSLKIKFPNLGLRRFIEEFQNYSYQNSYSLFSSTEQNFIECIFGFPHRTTAAVYMGDGDKLLIMPPNSNSDKYSLIYGPDILSKCIKHRNQIDEALIKEELKYESWLAMQEEFEKEMRDQEYLDGIESANEDFYGEFDGFFHEDML